MDTSALEDVTDYIQYDLVETTKSWKKKRILLYAHGGLVSEESAVQHVADYRQALLANEVYPLSFVWKTDYWTTLQNMLKDALSRRRPEGILDAAKDFLLDRLDDALEPVARTLTGKAEWDEMKENAVLASSHENGGARLTLNLLAGLAKADSKYEFHLVGHSAGGIFQSALVQLLTTAGEIATGPLKGMTGLGLKAATCTLWAPACTMELFEQTYLPAIQRGQIGNFALFTLTGQAEQDDNCAQIYHKSLLYLVSNACEAKARIPLFRDGVPLLGMEKFVRQNAKLMRLFRSGEADWVLSPNNADEGSPDCAKAAHHGDFDDDKSTVLATLARILGRKRKTVEMSFAHSTASRRDLRLRLG